MKPGLNFLSQILTAVPHGFVVILFLILFILLRVLLFRLVLVLFFICVLVVVSATESLAIKDLDMNDEDGTLSVAGEVESSLQKFC